MAIKPKKSTRRRQFASVLTEEMKTFIHLCIKDGEAAAAQAMNLKSDEAKELLRQKPVAEYLKQYRHQFLKQMAAYEVSRITRCNVTREDVISRYWALALMSPDETRGNIEGQKQALDEIAGIFGMKFSPRDADKFFDGKSPEQLENYATYGKFDPSEEDKKAALNAGPGPGDTERD